MAQAARPLDKASSREEMWPPLPLQAWKETRDTLHLWTQVVGKVRLALAPMEPQWAQVPLYVTSRGLTTSPIPCARRTFQIDFDLCAHELVIATSEARPLTIPLSPRSVASFHREVLYALHGLGCDVRISPKPSEIPDPIPFADDEVHRSYDREAVNRFFHVLSRVDIVMKEHRARFRGKASPVQFFWGSFDLAYSRFSGRPADPPPGADKIFRFAMDAEEVAFGFWPGDDRFLEPAFYAYTYPKPAAIEQAAIRPEAASWSQALGEHVLPYDAVRRAEDPRAAILEFLETYYRAGATLAGWDLATLDASEDARV